MTAIKTYVLMVAKTFPATHPRAGEETGFREKIINGDKIHTIRGNYILWMKRAEKINSGKASLSLRQWTGKPYASKQLEIMKLDKIGIQSVTIVPYSRLKNLEIAIAGIRMNDINIAHNDGLTLLDMYFWFKESVNYGAVIHFTDFRYE